MSEGVIYISGCDSGISEGVMVVCQRYNFYF